MKIKLLPALSDNYMYLIIDEDTREAAIVDPVAPETVLKAVQEENVKLKKILTTHHHWDHAGGNEDMVKKVPDLEVYGGDDRIGALTHKVKMGDKFTIGKINVECLFTPCHTTGHICYVLDDGGDSSSVFTGDTLFSAGCGRFFEGTAEQMFRNLIEVLGKLPDDTKVFCGHEYTLQNLRYAKHVEPNNVDIQQRIEWCREKRENGEPTVPSTIGIEKLINPFMRVGISSVQQHTQKENLVDVMHALRKEKDTFK
ncbi:hydroxyacylglutathione hydrolase, mitochondrial isoform X2 [Chrysoperla carnea]|nr:hydroxyacylglutathione hydrolase, mitochondrial isoform X2 [Chrysoperla carnea]XP_044734007.1 hydroxyacylglutathione hydrolase, mitochondrial isoform X2 [Chrysoperla carnea]